MRNLDRERRAELRERIRVTTIGCIGAAVSFSILETTPQGSMLNILAFTGAIISSAAVICPVACEIDEHASIRSVIHEAEHIAKEAANQH